MRFTTMLRRAGSIVNPPSNPYDPGPVPTLRDYPVARRAPSPRRVPR
jgi:hypothetical protein